MVIFMTGPWQHIMRWVSIYPWLIGCLHASTGKFAEIIYGLGCLGHALLFVDAAGEICECAKAFNTRLKCTLHPARKSRHKGKAEKNVL